MSCRAWRMSVGGLSSSSVWSLLGALWVLLGSSCTNAFTTPLTRTVVHRAFAPREVRTRLCGMNPLYQGPPPARKGFAELPKHPGNSLYYELRGVENDEKVLLIVGASATSRQFEQIADGLASNGYQVLTYDHRGIGRSSKRDKEEHEGDWFKSWCYTTAKHLFRITATPTVASTCQDLADDAIQVANSAWGSSARFHTYGMSLGGWTTQALALNHIDRLKSLHIYGSNRGPFYRFPFLWPLKLGVYFFLPWISPRGPEKNIDATIKNTMTPEYRKRLLNGRPIAELWRERWMAEYDQWYPAEKDRDVVAGQNAAIMYWRLGDMDAAILRRARAAKRLPITVYMGERDQLIKPPSQKELARVLGATSEVVPGGHLGEIDENGDPAILAPLLRNLRLATNRDATEGEEEETQYDNVPARERENVRVRA